MKTRTQLSFALLATALIAAAGLVACDKPAVKSRETIAFDGNSNNANFGINATDGTTPLMERIDPTLKAVLVGDMPPGGTAFKCQVLTTLTTSTQITGCEVVTGKSFYVKSVEVSGDAANATATPWVLQSGTSTACTGARILAEGWHAATTTVPMRFDPPLKATASDGLCILDGTTGSKAITVSGWLAP